MAGFDSRGLMGRPGLRRALGTLNGDDQDAFAASTADIDPKRFSSLYKQRASQFLDEQRQLNASRGGDLLLQRQQELAQAGNRNSPNSLSRGPGSIQTEEEMLRRRGLSRGGYGF